MRATKTSRVSPILCLIATSLILCSPAVSDTRSHQGKIKNAVFKPGKYLSPDRRYLVTFSLGDASEADTFLVRDRHTSKHTFHVNGLDKVNGFLWIPSEPHTLIMSVKLNRGKPYIALWNSSSLKKILLGELKRNEDPDIEQLKLIGLSQDNKHFIYEHEYDPASASMHKAHARIPHI